MVDRVSSSEPLLLLLVAAERHFAEALQEHLVAAGFHDHRLVHHNVMAHVAYTGIRLTELAAKAGVTKQAMSELVLDLERLGYLKRSPDPADARAKLITFTDKGRSAVDAAMQAFERMEAQLSERLGKRGLAALRGGLSTALEAPLSPPPAPRARAGA